MSDVIRVGSACSGVGALELGLIAALGGGEVAWHAECDKHPAAVLDARFPGVPNYGDLAAVDWSAVAPVDWFTAGYPCQPDSLAGKGLSEDDHRWIWPEVARAIGVLRPPNVLLENVAGHFVRGFRTVLGSLAALGYDARWTLVRASDAGAPHKRERLFVVASDAAQRGRGRPEGQQRRLGDAERLAAAPDADDQRHERRRSAWDGRSGSSDDGSLAPADSDDDAAWDRLEGRDSITSGTESAQCGCPVDRQWRTPDGNDYSAAIRRWHDLTSCVPEPTEAGRLNPRFNEWMMGLPAGWVTDILPRSPALKAIGNGVVPQQAALAVQLLLPTDSTLAEVG